MATAIVSNTPDCSICRESFNISLSLPKILPCGHTFCLACVERCIADKQMTFPCSFCKQDVEIPEGGAKMFITNFIVLTFNNTTQNQLPSTKQPKCFNHNQKEVDYYCNNCNVGLCSKCISKEHKDHETLDIQCEETRNKAIEKLQQSKNIIQNRIKHLEKTRSTLLESFDKLKSLCEDTCTKVTEKTEEVISDLRIESEEIIEVIRGVLDVNRVMVQDRENKITKKINVLESNMESIISPSTKTTLNILLTLPGLIEKEKLDESREGYNLCLQYLQWVGKDFSLDINTLGSVISKSFYILGSYQFLFDISDIKKDCSYNYNRDKFRNDNLVWSCYVRTCGDDLGIGFKLLRADNPKLDYCIIDYQISLLNIDDDNKTLTTTVKNVTIKRGHSLRWYKPITWSKLTDKNNGYLTSNGQFVIQYETTHIRVNHGNRV